MPSAGAFTNSERTQTSEGSELLFIESAVSTLFSLLLSKGLDCQSLSVFFLFFYLLELAVSEAVAAAPGGAGG